MYVWYLKSDIVSGRVDTYDEPKNLFDEGENKNKKRT